MRHLSCHYRACARWPSWLARRSAYPALLTPISRPAPIAAHINGRRGVLSVADEVGPTMNHVEPTELLDSKWSVTNDGNDHRFSDDHTTKLGRPLATLIA